MISDFGVVQQERGEYAAALETQQAALDMYTALDDPIGRANALCHLGSMNTDRGRHADAIADLQRAEELYLNGGDLWNVAGARYFLGVAQRLAGDYEAAGDSLGAALETYRAAGDLLDQARRPRRDRADPIATGRYARAQACLEEALAIYDGLDARNGVVTVIDGARRTRPRFRECGRRDRAPRGSSLDSRGTRHAPRGKRALLMALAGRTSGSGATARLSSERRAHGICGRLTRRSRIRRRF